jgi:hypothetical protein
MFIDIGGKERKLKFDYNSICDLEERASIGIMELMGERAGFNTLRLLLWAGLKSSNSGIALRDVGEWIQESLDGGVQTIESLFDIVGKEFVNSGLLGNVSAEGK